MLFGTLNGIFEKILRDDKTKRAGKPALFHYLTTTIYKM
jgi:hypothetical protein